ncbi:hypothetical protein D5086_015537 [Populus alba]|uniref:Uncharacterized protein n=3 Tax=Populus TaxID=3689 RepID=A0ACC4BS63_POPAL|nr:hypothetical protein NC653_019928 [Populus alba x Populus x berolinensis]TKR66429.1 hypothetical protein D5086_0000311190 [Populus alba]
MAEDHGRSKFSSIQEWLRSLEYEACLAIVFLAVFLAMVFMPWCNNLQPPALTSFSGQVKFLFPIMLLLLYKLVLWFLPVVEGDGREQNVWFGSLVEGCSMLAGAGLIMLVFVLGSLQSTIHDSYSRPF